MSIEELLQQMEEFAARRKQKDYLPTWLRDFIKSAADVLEPLEYTGRAGFDCQLGERGWIVTIYLGTSEIIGGPRDGQIDHVSFRVELHRLMRLFTDIERLEWYSVSNATDDRFSSDTRSLISVIGTVIDDQIVQLELLGTPPRYVGPGLKRHEPGIEPQD